MTIEEIVKLKYRIGFVNNLFIFASLLIVSFFSFNGRGVYV